MKCVCVCEKCTTDTDEKSSGKWKMDQMAHIRTYIYVCTYICLKTFSSFRLPVTFDLRLQTRSGFETEQGKTQKNQKIWRAPRGKVQVCYSSCASLYKTATTRTTLLSTRPSPPCSLVNKEGLIRWQEFFVQSVA